jgi:hypothetical protein
LVFLEFQLVLCLLRVVFDGVHLSHRVDWGRSVAGADGDHRLFCADGDHERVHEYVCRLGEFADTAEVSFIADERRRFDRSAGNHLPGPWLGGVGLYGRKRCLWWRFFGAHRNCLAALLRAAVAGGNRRAGNVDDGDGEWIGAAGFQLVAGVDGQLWSGAVGVGGDPGLTDCRQPVGGQSAAAGRRFLKELRVLREELLDGFEGRKGIAIPELLAFQRGGGARELELSRGRPVVERREDHGTGKDIAGAVGVNGTDGESGVASGAFGGKVQRAFLSGGDGDFFGTEFHQFSRTVFEVAGLEETRNESGWAIEELDRLEQGRQIGLGGTQVHEDASAGFANGVHGIESGGAGPAVEMEGIMRGDASEIDFFGLDEMASSVGGDGPVAGITFNPDMGEAGAGVGGLRWGIEIDFVCEEVSLNDLAEMIFGPAAVKGGLGPEPGEEAEGRGDRAADLVAIGLDFAFGVGFRQGFKDDLVIDDDGAQPEDGECSGMRLHS